jgi:hypothetical protein
MILNVRSEVNMKATDFVRLVPELRAWLESREAVLENVLVEHLVSDPESYESRVAGGRLFEIRHLRNQLAHIERTQALESEVCLGW